MRQLKQGSSSTIYLNMPGKKQTQRTFTFAIQMWDLRMQCEVKIYERNGRMSAEHYGYYQILECMHVDKFTTHSDSFDSPHV